MRLKKPENRLLIIFMIWHQSFFEYRHKTPKDLTCNLISFLGDGKPGEEANAGEAGGQMRRYRPRRNYDGYYRGARRGGPAGGAQQGENGGEGGEPARYNKGEQGGEGAGEGGAPRGGGGRGRGGPPRRFFRRNGRGGRGGGPARRPRSQDGQVTLRCIFCFTKIV